MYAYTDITSNYGIISVPSHWIPEVFVNKSIFWKMGQNSFTHEILGILKCMHIQTLLVTTESFPCLLTEFPRFSQPKVFSENSFTHEKLRILKCMHIQTLLVTTESFPCLLTEFPRFSQPKVFSEKTKWIQIHLHTKTSGFWNACIYRHYL